jgi:hypothetical protein
MSDEREDEKRTDLPLLLWSGMECFRKGEFDERLLATTVP